MTKWNRLHAFDRGQVIGLSQAALAKKAKVSQPAIAQIETGKTDPSVKTLAKIADALGVDIAVLFARANVHIFDMDRLRKKYDHVDKLTDNLYAALGKVVSYAKEIGFTK